MEWDEVEWHFRGISKYDLGTPVGMRRGKHELKFHDARVVLQLPVLDAVELIGYVCSPDIDLIKRDRKKKKVIMLGCLKKKKVRTKMM